MKTILLISASGNRYFRRINGLWQHVAPSENISQPTDKSRLWIIANLPDEMQETLELPPLIGTDRKRFLERRLVASFPHSTYRSATKIFGYRFKHSTYILGGLSDEKSLNEEISKQDVPVAGVWGMAMLLTLLMKRLSIANILLVVPGEHDLRILVLKDGIPILTRCIPRYGATTNDDQGDQKIENRHTRDANEILRTRQHLENRGIFDHNTLPPLLYLGDASPISEYLQKTGQVFTSLPDSLLPRGEAAYLHPLFEKVITSPAGQLAPAQVRVRALSENIRQAAYLGIAACLLTTVLLNQENFRKVIRLHDRESRLEADLQQANHERTQLTQRITAFGLDPKRVRQAARFAILELDHAPTLASILQLLAAAIADQPEVRIKSLAYRLPRLHEHYCQGSNVMDSVEDADENRPRLTELQFTLLLPEHLETNSRIGIYKRISSALKKTDGIHLLQDPSTLSLINTLKSGQDKNSALPENRWCLSVTWPPSPNRDLP